MVAHSFHNLAFYLGISGFTFMIMLNLVPPMFREVKTPEELMQLEVRCWPPPQHPEMWSRYVDFHCRRKFLNGDVRPMHENQTVAPMDKKNESNDMLNRPSQRGRLTAFLVASMVVVSLHFVVGSIEALRRYSKILLVTDVVAIVTLFVHAVIPHILISAMVVGSQFERQDGVFMCDFKTQVYKNLRNQTVQCYYTIDEVALNYNYADKDLPNIAILSSTVCAVLVVFYIGNLLEKLFPTVNDYVTMEMAINDKLSTKETFMQ